MSRSFDRSVPSVVDFLHGNVFSLSGNLTWACFYKTLATNAYGLIRAQDGSSNLCFGANPYADGNVYWTNGGSSATGDTYPAATWAITAFSQNGTAVTGISWNATSGTWTSTPRGTAGNFANPVTQMRVGVFNPGNHDALDGLIACQAIWNRPLVVGDFAGFQSAMDAWLATTPIWAAQFNQASPTTMPVDLTGGGGDAFSQTSTTVSADDPPGFVYHGAAPSFDPKQSSQFLTFF